MKKRRIEDEGNDRRILKSLQDKSGIIDEETADLIVERMREVMGPIFSTAENFGVNAQELVRSQSLFHACKGSREKKGLTVKQTAALLKVPQYRIKAVEGESSSSIRTDILERYIVFLELGAFYGKWKQANKDIFARWEAGR